MTVSPMTDTNVQNLSSELAQRPIEMMVKEWRQVAIAEGIAPTKVDQYLLTRSDVPEDIKAFIHKYISAEQRDIDGTASGVVATETKLTEESLSPQSGLSKVISPVSTEQPKVVSGEVDMLNARSEIESIKRDVIEPSEAEMQAEEEKNIQELRPSIKPEEEVSMDDNVSTVAGDRQYEEVELLGRVPIGISGYAPSKDIADNAAEIAEKGPISDAKTWQAMLLQRFLQIWGSFRGIFSQ